MAAPYDIPSNQTFSDKLVETLSIMSLDIDQDSALLGAVFLLSLFLRARVFTLDIILLHRYFCRPPVALIRRH